VAFIGAIIIGLSLGLFGSGGSILTVPVLLYLVGQSPEIAIASSLIIVAGISLLASVRNVFARVISWRHVLVFGVPGMVGTYGGAWLGIMSSSAVQLTVFALLMFVAAILMWRKRPVEAIKPVPWNPLKVLVEGLVVGVITGFVGVGGGFLIVPALVILGGLALPQAVATSLVVIALKSVVGFTKYYVAYTATGLVFDWWVIGLMIGAGFLGSYAGSWLARRLPSQKLQRGFAIFLMLMAGFVLYQSV